MSVLLVLIPNSIFKFLFSTVVQGVWGKWLSGMLVRASPLKAFTLPQSDLNGNTVFLIFSFWSLPSTALLTVTDRPCMPIRSSKIQGNEIKSVLKLWMNTWIGLNWAKQVFYLFNCLFLKPWLPTNKKSWAIFLLHQNSSQEHKDLTWTQSYYSLSFGKLH